MDHGVRPGFEANEKQGNDCEDDLEPLRAFLFRGQFAPPPLRGRAIAQVANPRQDSEIHHGSERRRDQHGDANGVLVPAFRWSIDSTGRGECREADGHAIPLMVRTAVHRLWSRANMALVQPIVRNCRRPTKKPDDSEFALGESGCCS